MLKQKVQKVFDYSKIKTVSKILFRVNVLAEVFLQIFTKLFNITLQTPTDKKLDSRRHNDHYLLHMKKPWKTMLSQTTLHPFDKMLIYKCISAIMNLQNKVILL